MSGSERSPRRVALVEDADESDNPIPNTRRYAESVASPVKERPNTGRTRKEKARRDSTSPLASGFTDSDSTVHPREKSARDRERRESRDSREFSSPHKKALETSKPDLAMRPAAKHANTTPHLSYRSSDEASYYGVATVTPARSGSRPRAATTQRPASYYGPRPPQANAQFYARQPMAPAPMPMPTSYPPQSWAQAGHMAYPMMSPAIPPPAPDYLSVPQMSSAQRLQSRLGGRPTSAMGMRPSPALSQEYYEPDEERHLVRRPSRKAKDRMAMPPPARPQSARPIPMFRPPSTPAPRKDVRFEKQELEDPTLFQVSPPYEYPPHPVRGSRRPSIGATAIPYDSVPYREVASNTRRNSYRNSVSSMDFIEDQVRRAQEYQEDVAGGPQLALTAESLRRASRNGGSSRSTRSTESRDESDYRHSATTRTTRSSNPPDDDATIRIKGVRSVEVGGVMMHCDDGAEINIGTARPSSNYRGGSDRSSYMAPEDRDHLHHHIEDGGGRRMPRIDRPPTRTRSGSQAGSFSRTSRYETAPPAPPLVPRYDSTRYDQWGYPVPPYTSYPPPPPPGYI